MEPFIHLQMIKMLIVVVVCYTVCWLPFNIYWVRNCSLHVWMHLHWHLRVGEASLSPPTNIKLRCASVSASLGSFSYVKPFDSEWHMLCIRLGLWESFKEENWQHEWNDESHIDPPRAAWVDRSNILCPTAFDSIVSTTFLWHCEKCWARKKVAETSNGYVRCYTSMYPAYVGPRAAEFCLDEWSFVPIRVHGRSHPRGFAHVPKPGHLLLDE